MAAAIPEERLRAVWEMLTAQFGAVKSVEERRSGEIKGLRAVELILAFEHGDTASCEVSRTLGSAYLPSMLNAKNRLPPLPSAPDRA